jgi:hypothetical protein
MDKNIESYVKVYDGWLDAEICKKIVTELESPTMKDTFHQHTFYNTTDKSYKAQSGDRELDVSYANITTRDYLMQRVWDGFARYFTELNFPWFTNWAGFSGVRFNKYSEDRLMARHCDHIHSMFDGQIKGIPTLSFVGVLNDDYEGGEFVMWLDDVIELKAGSVMIFPSNFLYPHRVDPIKKGTRHSFVSWAY